MIFSYSPGDDSSNEAKDDDLETALEEEEETCELVVHKLY